MSLQDAVSLLARTPLFEGVDRVRLEVLAFTARHLAFAEGETLAEEGTDADGALLLLSGEAVMMASGVDGRGTAARLDEGDLVGEAALTQPARWAATVRAARPVEALKLERDVFLRLADEFPEIAQGCLRSSASQVAALGADLAALDRDLKAARDAREALQTARRLRRDRPARGTDISKPETETGKDPDE